MPVSGVLKDLLKSPAAKPLLRLSLRRCCLCGVRIAYALRKESGTIALGCPDLVRCVVLCLNSLEGRHAERSEASGLSKSSQHCVSKNVRWPDPSLRSELAPFGTLRAGSERGRRDDNHHTTSDRTPDDVRTVAVRSVGGPSWADMRVSH